MKGRTAARLAWTLWGLFVAGLGGLFILGHVNGSPITLVDVTQLLAFAAMMTVGALVASRRPENPIGWIYCGIALFFLLGGALADGYATYALITRPGSLPGGQLAVWIQNWAFFPAIGMLFTFSLLLFPDGRLPSPRWKPVAWGAVAATVVGSLGFALSSADYTDINGDPASNPFAVDGLTGVFNVVKNVGGIMLVAIAVLCAASLIVRFRRSRSEEREQLKWLMYTGALNALFLITTGWFELGDGNFLDVVFGVLIALIPFSAGIAILKYRLYDVDVVISKTVVFGALAGFITAVYVALVVGVGTLLGRGDEPNLALSIAATALVAVAFQPVRERAQRFANRLVYGKRATPYEVMAGFSQRMAGALSIEDALPEMAAAAARGVGAVRSRVRLFLPEGKEEFALWPQDQPGDGFGRAIEVTHQGEPVGEVAVAKPPGEPLTPAEAKLLEDLASQAGLALHNVRLAAELRGRLEEISAQSEALRLSQQRIVTARDVQRRGLEREIREGAQQQLMVIAAKLRTATDLVELDPERAMAVLDELGSNANATLEQLRDLARGIFPPLLADKGIVSALEAHLRKEGIPAALDSSIGLKDKRFDQDIEGAVYFCCIQALQNAGRHADGREVLIRLAAADGMVEFEVSDEGTGFDPTSTGEGMGFQIMRDRVEALDGTLDVDSSPGRGTTVIGRVPGRTSEGV